MAFRRLASILRSEVIQIFECARRFPWFQRAPFLAGWAIPPPARTIVAAENISDNTYLEAPILAASEAAAPGAFLGIPNKNLEL